MNETDLEEGFWIMFFIGSSEMRQNWYGDLTGEERAYVHGYAARIGGHISKYLDAIAQPVMYIGMPQLDDEQRQRLAESQKRRGWSG